MYNVQVFCKAVGITIITLSAWASMGISAEPKHPVDEREIPDFIPLRQVEITITPLSRTPLTNCMAFSPNGETVVMASASKTLTMWNVRTGRKLRAFSGHADYISCLAFSPDGKQFASGSEPRDTTAILWDANTGEKLHVLKGHINEIESIAFSPDGKYLVTTSADDTSIIWDAQTGVRRYWLRGHTDSVYASAFSPDSKQLVTASEDATSIIWDVQTGRKLRVLEGGSGRVISATFSKDGKQIALGAIDKKLGGYSVLWNPNTGDKIRTFSGYFVSFCADSKIVVVAADGACRLCDVQTGQVRTVFKEISGPITFALLDPSGAHLVTASVNPDSGFVLWDVLSGKKLRMLDCEGGSFASATFSPDGKLLLTGSVSGAELWDIASGAKRFTFSDAR